MCIHTLGVRKKLCGRTTTIKYHWLFTFFAFFELFTIVFILSISRSRELMLSHRLDLDSVKCRTDAWILNSHANVNFALNKELIAQPNSVNKWWTWCGVYGVRKKCEEKQIEDGENHNALNVSKWTVIVKYLAEQQQQQQKAIFSRSQMIYWMQMMPRTTLHIHNIIFSKRFIWSSIHDFRFKISRTIKRKRIDEKSDSHELDFNMYRWRARWSFFTIAASLLFFPVSNLDLFYWKKKTIINIDLSHFSSKKFHIRMQIPAANTRQTHSYTFYHTVVKIGFFLFGSACVCWAGTNVATV